MKSAVCNNEDESRGYYTKWHVRQKDKYHTISLFNEI